MTAAEKSFLNQLRNGGLVGIYLGSIKRRYVGGGGRADCYWASAKMSGSAQSIRMRTVFLGGEFEFRVPFGGMGSHVYFSLGTGLAFYKETGTFRNGNYSLEYMGVPVRAGLGIQLKVAPSFGFIAGAHALLGSVNHKLFETSGAVSISRIGATGGIAFTF